MPIRDGDGVEDQLLIVRIDPSGSDSDDGGAAKALDLPVPQSAGGRLSPEFARLEALSSVHFDSIVGGAIALPDVISLAGTPADAIAALPARADPGFFYFGEEPGGLPGFDHFQPAPDMSPISAAVDAILSGGQPAGEPAIFDGVLTSALDLGAVADRLSHEPGAQDARSHYVLAAIDIWPGDFGLSALGFDRPVKAPVPGDDPGI